MIARELDKDTLNENVPKVPKNCGATAAARQQQDHLRPIFVSFLLRLHLWPYPIVMYSLPARSRGGNPSDKGAAGATFSYNPGAAAVGSSSPNVGSLRSSGRRSIQCCFHILNRDK
jgi:hypothetical protein